MLEFSIINRFTPWEKELDSSSNQVDLNISIRLTDKGVEGVRPLLQPELLPFKPVTIGLDSGKEIAYSSIDDPVGFILSELRKKPMLTLSGVKKTENDFPEMISFGLVEKGTAGGIAYYTSYNKSFQENKDLIISLLPKGAVRQAFFYATAYSRLINARNYFLYKYKKGLNTFINEHREKQVDISDRPGRQTTFNNTFFFKGAAEYWFGRDFFEVFSKEKLLAFPHAIEIKEVNDDLVKIRLFDSPFSGLKPEEIELHQLFRDYLGVDRT